jgi:hypothetical protein
MNGLAAYLNQAVCYRCKAQTALAHAAGKNRGHTRIASRALLVISAWVAK